MVRLGSVNRDFGVRLPRLCFLSIIRICFPKPLLLLSLNDNDGRIGAVCQVYCDDNAHCGHLSNSPPFYKWTFNLAFVFPREKFSTFHSRDSNLKPFEFFLSVFTFTLLHWMKFKIRSFASLLSHPRFRDRSTKQEIFILILKSMTRSFTLISEGIKYFLFRK